MKRLVFWSVLTLSLAVNTTVAVQVLRARTPALPLMQVLTLGAEQKARIMELRRSFLAERQGVRERTSALRAELADLLTADHPDAAAIEAVIGRISESQVTLQHRVVDHVLAVRGVLTAEQRPRFEELMRKQLAAGVPTQEECPMSALQEMPR
jgi:Spy/CpxP family protein refolding chaperone